jgi:hypothetical protein
MPLLVLLLGIDLVLGARRGATLSPFQYKPQNQAPKSQGCRRRLCGANSMLNNKHRPVFTRPELHVRAELII